MTKLEKLIETLWFDVSSDCVPCEYGIKCPFYDYDKKDNTYCRNGDCLTAMVVLVEKLFKEQDNDNKTT